MAVSAFLQGVLSLDKKRTMLILVPVAILLPTVLHALFAALIVYIHQSIDGDLRLPASIVSIPNPLLTSPTNDPPDA